MKIAILGAMSEEITPLLKTPKNYTEIEYANDTYYFANYKGHELILAYSKMGKVNSALSASVMTEKLGTQVLLSTGAVDVSNPELKIGDLLYTTKLAQYDLGITTFGHSLGLISGSETFIKIDDKLDNLTLEVARELNIRLRAGTIATSDEFICNEAKKAEIRGIFSADVCEVEGANVALVCDALRMPCSILRVMSDKAGEKAEFDFGEFVINSAKISVNFIPKMCEKL